MHTLSGSFTCRKYAIWDKRLYFPSKRRAEDFFRPEKIRRLRPGLNPRTWVPKASTLPLNHSVYLMKFFLMWVFFTERYVKGGLKMIMKEIVMTRRWVLSGHLRGWAEENP